MSDLGHTAMPSQTLASNVTTAGSPTIQHMDSMSMQSLERGVDGAHGRALKSKLTSHSASRGKAEEAAVTGSDTISGTFDGDATRSLVHETEMMGASVDASGMILAPRSIPGSPREQSPHNGYGTMGSGGMGHALFAGAQAQVRPKRRERGDATPPCCEGPPARALSPDRPNGPMSCHPDAIASPPASVRVGPTGAVAPGYALDAVPVMPPLYSSGVHVAHPSMLPCIHAPLPPPLGVPSEGRVLRGSGVRVGALPYNAARSPSLPPSPRGRVRVGRSSLPYHSIPPPGTGRHGSLKRHSSLNRKNLEQLAVMGPVVRPPLSPSPPPRKRSTSPAQHPFNASISPHPRVSPRRASRGNFSPHTSPPRVGACVPLQPVLFQGSLSPIPPPPESVMGADYSPSPARRRRSVSGSLRDLGRRIMSLSRERKQRKAEPFMVGSRLVAMPQTSHMPWEERMRERLRSG